MDVFPGRSAVEEWTDLEFVLEQSNCESAGGWYMGRKSKGWDVFAKRATERIKIHSGLQGEVVSPEETRLFALRQFNNATGGRWGSMSSNFGPLNMPLR